MSIQSLDSLKIDEFKKLIAKIDVRQMSLTIFNIDYDELKKIIYPNPHYRFFTILKRNGSKRVIHEPNSKLKDVQYKLLFYIRTIYPVEKACVHGFVPKRSILTNAQAHANQKTHLLLNLDLEDFFPSISFKRVRGMFQSQPFNFSYQVATVLAQICTFQERLPQGAPTSPIIANLICRSLDSDLMRLARRHRSVYTRYADDISFSFSVRNTGKLPQNICSYESGVVYLGDELVEIIDRHSFKINSNKNRISTRFSRMEVTGLTINEFPNVQRKFIDEIRGALNAWKKYGYAKTQAYWTDRFTTNSSKILTTEIRTIWNRQTRTGKLPEFSCWLWGKLLYLRMVRGGDDEIYSTLAEKYNSLISNSSFEKKAPKLPLEAVVRSQWSLDKAVFVIEVISNFKLNEKSQSTMVYAQGTAFAYKSHGLITCAHLFNCDFVHEDQVYKFDLKDERFTDIEIVVKSPKEKKEYQVILNKIDFNYDLALLKMSDPCEILDWHLSSGHIVPAKDQEGFLIGFPNWSPGKVDLNRSSIKITNTFNRSSLSRVEISQTIRKGNSGGPIVDKSYRVLGVAQLGATQAEGNDECLSVVELDNWLSSS
ncbi:reverse transcriptase domain-containing protein [Limnobacter sp.]|uniref:reverse transcriptase domain-containing protein n=1 Tax=Limnobacter sp. TaxID=2003368 RepID=UPI00311F4666